MTMELITFICLALVAIFVKHLFFTPKRVPKWRRASFASKVMSEGVYPAEKNIPQPVIQSVFEMENMPEMEIIANHLKESLLFYNRFRSIPEYDSKGTMMGWGKPIDPDNIDMKEHIKEKKFNSREEMQNFVDLQCAASISMNKPLWEMYIMRFPEVKKGGIVLVRVHHAIADGLSLVQSLSRVFTDKAGKPVELPSAALPGGKKSKFSLAFIVKFLKAVLKVLYLPLSAADTSTCVRQKGEYTWSGVRKTVNMTPIPIETLKMVKNNAKCTINDVMVALVSGMFRRYLSYRKEATVNSSLFQMRALIPFAFPRQSSGSDPDAMRNLWCFLSLPLPVSEDTAEKRVHFAKKQMDAMKSSPESFVQLKLNEIASKFLPRSVSGGTILDIMTKHSCIFTNVPGPSETIYFLGEPVSVIDIPIGNIVPQLSAFSYGGKLRFNCVVDPMLYTESEKLAQFYEDEFNELKRCYNVDQ